MFQQCLVELAAYIKKHILGAVSIVAPWKIGYGLTGDNWPHYQDIFMQWVTTATSKDGGDVTVVIYKLSRGEEV